MKSIAAITAPSENNPFSIDLNQTKNPYSQPSDFVWDGEWFVFVGADRVNCSAFRCLAPDLALSLRDCLLKFSQEQKQISDKTLLGWVQNFRHLLHKDPTAQFDEIWVYKAFTNSGFSARRTIYESFFLYWSDRYPNAVTPEALRHIAKTMPRAVGNRNVLSDDPEKSWLSDIEYDLLLAHVWKNYDDGIVGTQSTLLRLLSMQYARRPLQHSSLKVCDFLNNAEVEEGISGRRIRFPGAKDPAAEHNFRDSKVEIHPIADHLWELFELQRSEIKCLFENVLNVTLSDIEVLQLPLFSSSIQIVNASTALTTHYGLDWRKHLDHRLFHLDARKVSKILRWDTHEVGSGQGPKVQRPISHRTNRSLVVNANRLRHTRARQLARLGTPKHVLSFWLGHTHGKSLDAYYSDPAEEARQINDLMAATLTPLALAFAGKLIDNEAQASRADDPESKLEFADDGHLKNVGNCGKHSFCATTSIPIPCYRCKHFEPLVFAPHDEVLQALLARQAEENAMIRIGGSRRLLTPIDLSADIRAVRACIERCAARQREIEECRTEWQK